MKTSHSFILAAATAALVFVLALVVNLLVAPTAVVALAAMPLVFLTDNYAKPRRGYLRDRVTVRHPLPLAA